MSLLKEHNKGGHMCGKVVRACTISSGTLTTLWSYSLKYNVDCIGKPLIVAKTKRNL